MLRKSIVLAIWVITFFFTAEINIRGQEVGNGLVEKDIEAIQCWLKSDRNSIRIGERFYVTLTCRVIEAESGKAVPLESVLEPAAVSFPPYEVVQGTRYQDIKEGSFRYIQYQYDLRLMGDEFFGKEVPIPSLEIKYKIQRKISNEESLDSREKIYKLPPLPVKISSLVPKNTKDIRDASADNFGVVKTRMFRAYASFSVAVLLLILPLIIALVPLVRSIRHFKQEKSNGTTFSNASLLRRLKRELRFVGRTSSKTGWNAELVGKMVTISRVAGSVALSGKISQLSTRFETRGLEGQLKLRKGILWPKKVLISSSLTPESMEKLILEDKRVSHYSEGYQRLLAAMLKVQKDLVDVRYSGNSTFDDGTTAMLNHSLDRSMSYVLALSDFYFWPVLKIANIIDRVHQSGWRLPWKRF